jgi:hypothetical protein
VQRDAPKTSREGGSLTNAIPTDRLGRPGLDALEIEGIEQRVRGVAELLRDLQDPCASGGGDFRLVPQSQRDRASMHLGDAREFGHRQEQTGRRVGRNVWA